jgi:hypothetical protein
MTTVSTIVCCYRQSPAHVAATLACLGRETGSDFGGVIVDNAGTAKDAHIPGWRVIPGSNALMDFSGYCEGLSALGTHQDAVLVLNDTLFTDHNAGFMLARLLRYRDFIAACDTPAIAGKVDHYFSVCFANPWSGANAYVSSFAFLLSAKALPILPRLYAEVDEIMGDPALALGDPGWAPGLDPQFRAYLRLHLLTDFDPRSWYRLKAGAVAADVLARKARCVYLEHRLSGEIARKGVIVSLFPRGRDKIKFVTMERFDRVKRRVSIGRLQAQS